MINNWFKIFIWFQKAFYIAKLNLTFSSQINMFCWRPSLIGYTAYENTWLIDSPNKHCAIVN